MIYVRKLWAISEHSVLAARPTPSQLQAWHVLVQHTISIRLRSCGPQLG